MTRVIQDLFTVAMNGGSILRYGRMAVVTLEGTKLVTTCQDIQKAQCWGRSIPTSGVERDDRERLLDQLDTRIGLTDSACPTRGNSDALRKLAIQMRERQMDLDAWSIPLPVIDSLPAYEPPPPEPEPVPTRLIRRPAPQRV
jgi:hypothetical protein